MKRPQAQAVLPFGRKERVANRQRRQRIEGKKVQPGPGRPRLKNGRVSHRARPLLAANSALHITIKAKSAVPNLRTRKRFNVIKRAFAKFCGAEGSLAPVKGFRLIHFAVLSNHSHFIVEADSKRALSMGMKKLLHSISRRLNALSVKEHGGSVSTLGGAYTQLKGWLGRVFADRYHVHLLKSPTEMSRAVRYVLNNAAHHAAHRSGKAAQRLSLDPCSSAGVQPERGVALTVAAKGFLLARAYRQLVVGRTSSG